MADSRDPGRTEGQAAEVLLQAELQQLSGRGEGAFLFADDAALLWCTAAGAALLGARTPAEATARSAEQEPWPSARIAELARSVAPVAGTRLERLRVIVGRRSDVLTLACRRIVLSSGRQVLLAVAMGRRPVVVGSRSEPAADLPDFLATPTDRPHAPAATAPVEGRKPAAPVTIEAISRKAGRPALRVLWRTNEEARFVGISPEIDELLGPGAAPAMGETMEAASRRGLRDPEGRFAAALAGRDTFTGLTVLCPIIGYDAFLPVVMSGVPSFGPERRFEGFRGFGVCRLETMVDATGAALESATPVAPPDAPVPEAPAEELREGPAALPGGDAPPASSGGAVLPFGPVHGSAQGQLASTNVVQLKQTPRTGPQRLPQPGLSRTERHAFREIARALGARVEGDEEDGTGVPSEVQADSAPPEAATAGPRQGAADASPAGGGVPGIKDGETPAALVPESPAETAHAAEGLGENGPEAGPADLVRDAEAEARDIAPPAAHEASPEPVAGQDETGAAESEPAEATGPDAPADAPGVADTAEAVLPNAEAPLAEAEPPAPAPAEEEPAVALAADEAGDAPAQPPASDLAANAAAIFDRLPIGILVSRGDVPIVMNRTLLDLTGYADIDAFHAEGGLPHLFRNASEQGPGPDGATLTITARDGSTLAVDARLQTVSWSGLPATLVSFRRAIDPENERKVRALEASLARRDREARELRAIMDTATDGVIVVDEEGHILSINRSGEALFGYDQAELVGETFITLFAPDSHATALDYLEGLRANGVASVLNDGREVVGRVRQGGRIPLFMTLGAVSEAPERKFCAVLRDITPWKKAESDLTEAKRAAEEASAQKSDFLAKISHEIRTPLSAIIGFAEVMIEERFGPIGNERYLEYLRDIHASGGHVISLVNDLLDLSKIEAGRFDLTFISVDVNEIVSRAVALMQPQAGTGRVVVRTALAARLPRVVADERSLRQIVLNLLSNGIKFTDPGGQVIVSTALTDQGEVAVRIRDTGIGMTDKEIETALEPFRQIATARRAGGTGLGLPLTKALVEANRAALTIRSARDAGTLVEVVFPTTRVLAE